jgi:tetrapyrrole methylase family protein / MazG family protein
MSFHSLIKLAQKLRSPTGCPWDRKQTISSLTPKLVEECAEVLAAIEKNDYENLSEELGDLLFNIIMIAEIAREKKFFTITKVLQKVERKIIARHSWVFGADRGKIKTAEQALEKWKENKMKV